MNTLVEIEEAIDRLPAEEYAELMGFPDEDWDRAMKADAAAGRLDFIDRQVARH